MTKRQIDIVTAIANFLNEHKYAPTNREIGDLTNLKSPSTVHGHLEKLRRKGVVDWEESKPRTLKLLVEVDHEGNVEALSPIGSEG